MQVVEMQDTHAICEVDGKQELVDMILVGDQPKGTWILNFLGAAREVMTAKDAEQARLAISAVSEVMQGEHEIDHLFADLIDREPQLPEHLQALVPKPSEPTNSTQE